MDYTGRSDHNLMEAARKGDRGAFTALVERHKNWLVNLLYHSLHDYHAAEDIAQEAFIRVFRKLHTYNTKALFTTWLYIIAINLTKTELRRRKSHNIRKESELKPRNHDDDSEPFGNMPGNPGNPDAETRAVWECLEFMDTGEKHLLILRDIQGFDYEELAGILDCPVGTIKSRLNRARMKFKDIYMRITK